jgi:hypothetical protein
VTAFGAQGHRADFGMHGPTRKVSGNLQEGEIQMKQLWIAVLLVAALLAWSPPVQAVKPNDPKATPTVFCTVLQEPDPALLGGWKGTAPLTLEDGSLDINPVKYWLYKFGDRYAIYFERNARGGRKRYQGWESWTISGKEIYSDKGIRIYTENGEVFFRWKTERAAKLKRFAPPR